MQVLPKDQEIRSITATGCRPAVVINLGGKAAVSNKAVALIMKLW